MELIRRLWHIGKYRDNKWLQQVHDNWFHHWVDWKTENTMKELDREVEELFDLWEEEDPMLEGHIYSEILEGETPLGGEMRLRHPQKPQEDL